MCDVCATEHLLHLRTQHARPWLFHLPLITPLHASLAVGSFRLAHACPPCMERISVHACCGTPGCTSLRAACVFKSPVMCIGPRSHHHTPSSHDPQGTGGECGLRGGYVEMTNIHPGAVDQMYKCASINLSPNTMGQVRGDGAWHSCTAHSSVLCE